MTSPTGSPRRILIYRIGQLGDTVVAIPALKAVRQAYPGAEIALLCDEQVGHHYILASDILLGSGLVDSFVTYPVGISGKLATLRSRFLLLRQLRSGSFDMLVYLAPSVRTQKAIRRDRRFFRLAGISQMIGMEGFPELREKEPGVPLPVVPSETDLLLARLGRDGIPVPTPGNASLEVPLGPADEEAVRAWLDRENAGDPAFGGRRWIGIAPGSKMPAKVWPEERFLAVMSSLIRRFDVWPVVFGGPEDAGIGRRLVSAWGRGSVAAGVLALRPATAALRRCALYLGNDTGTMHLAVAAGRPCVVPFSAREWRGMWYPYGRGHRVFRVDIECEGCALVDCIEKKKECLMRIGSEEVFQACADLMGELDLTKEKETKAD